MTRSALVAATLALATPMMLFAQMKDMPAAGQKKAAAAPKKAGMTDAQKIAEAETAAPPEISKHAAIMEPGATPTAPMKQLRAGTNGWMCMPSATGTGGDPMCADKTWQAWAGAYMGKTAPQLTGTGIAYMLKGDHGASNVNPYDEKETATNQWVVAPPHVMVLYADTKLLDSFPTDPKSGGPWVMWKGSPYAHLMVPVSATKAAVMPAK